jgi:hypothetical protein
VARAVQGGGHPYRLRVNITRMALSGLFSFLDPSGFHPSDGLPCSPNTVFVRALHFVKCAQPSKRKPVYHLGKKGGSSVSSLGSSNVPVVDVGVKESAVVCDSGEASRETDEAR